jgi:hypothetical protein
MQFSRGVVRFGGVFMRFGCVNMRGLGHVLISLLDGLVLSHICQVRALAFMQEAPSPAMEDNLYFVPWIHDFKL